MAEPMEFRAVAEDMDSAGLSWDEISRRVQSEFVDRLHIVVEVEDGYATLLISDIPVTLAKSVAVVTRQLAEEEAGLPSADAMRVLS